MYFLQHLAEQHLWCRSSKLQRIRDLKASNILTVAEWQHWSNFSNTTSEENLTEETFLDLQLLQDDDRSHGDYSAENGKVGCNCWKGDIVPPPPPPFNSVLFVHGLIDSGYLKIKYCQFGLISLKNAETSFENVSALAGAKLAKKGEKHCFELLREEGEIRVEMWIMPGMDYHKCKEWVTFDDHARVWEICSCGGYWPEGYHLQTLKVHLRKEWVVYKALLWSWMSFVWAWAWRVSPPFLTRCSTFFISGTFSCWSFDVFQDRVGESIEGKTQDLNRCSCIKV